MRSINFVPLLFVSFFLHAQQDYKVILDVTSKDTIDHKMAIRWANGILQAEPTAQVELVFFGQSLAMITKDRSVVSAEITRLASNRNAKFKVCTVAMKAHNLEVNQLVPGVETVPDGIYEIISKQRAGWGYIKVSH